MDIEVKSPNFDLNAERAARSLAQKYKETGKLSPSVMSTLKRYHEHSKTRDKLLVSLRFNGMTFNPFTDKAISHPHYQEGLPAPFNGLDHTHLGDLIQQDGFGGVETWGVSDSETLETLNRLQESYTPDFVRVSVYRALPVSKHEINDGDNIFLSRKLAEEYADDFNRKRQKAAEDPRHYVKPAKEDLRVIEEKVPSKWVYAYAPVGVPESYGFDSRETIAPEFLYHISEVGGSRVADAVFAMGREFKTKGVVSEERIRSLQKFFDDPQARKVLVETIRREMPFNPFTGGRFARFD